MLFVISLLIHQSKKMQQIDLPMHAILYNLGPDLMS
jgi:hypothetical protein